MAFPSPRQEERLIERHMGRVMKVGLLVESGSWNIPSLPVALLCFNVPDADESIAPPPQAKRGTQRERSWTFKVQEFIDDVFWRRIAILAGNFD